jgi:membrane protease YdiL (CAAX protease family)
MRKHKILLLSLSIEIAVIVSIALANAIGRSGFYLFYNLIYGILLSTIFPLWLTYKENNTLHELGIKKLGLREIVIILGFVVFSIGGQLIPIGIASVKFELLSLGFVPLIMTTFFEELLFRGYMQTRFEKQYGWIPALLLSGFFFSVYHLGYPGFRTIGDLLLLFAVGVGFALAFKLSGGSVIVSYFVNLPNAFLTYILKSNQFPVFDNHSIIIAAVTIAFIVVIMTFFTRKFNNRIHNTV